MIIDLLNHKNCDILVDVTLKEDNRDILHFKRFFDKNIQKPFIKKFILKFLRRYLLIK